MKSKSRAAIAALLFLIGCSAEGARTGTTWVMSDK
jgi:hypothetical protein